MLFCHLQGPAAPIGPLRVEGGTCGRVSLTVPVRRGGGVLGSGMFRLDLAASRDATAQRRRLGRALWHHGQNDGSCWCLAGAWRWPQSESGGGPGAAAPACDAPGGVPRQVPGDSESPSYSFSGAGGRPVPAAAGPGAALAPRGLSPLEPASGPAPLARYQWRAPGPACSFRDSESTPRRSNRQYTASRARIPRSSPPPV